jgi:hypothetical protein
VPGDEFLQLPNKSLNSILKNFGLTEKYRAENKTLGKTDICNLMRQESWYWNPLAV